MLVMTNNNVVVNIIKDTFEYKKVENEQYVTCEKANAQAVFIPSMNMYMLINTSDSLIEMDSISEEVIPYKYCYTSEEGFYENPDYVEPPKPVEVRVNDLEESTTTHAELQVETELEIDYRLSMIELGLV